MVYQEIATAQCFVIEVILVSDCCMQVKSKIVDYACNLSCGCLVLCIVVSGIIGHFYGNNAHVVLLKDLVSGSKIKASKSKKKRKSQESTFTCMMLMQLQTL